MHLCVWARVYICMHVSYNNTLHFYCYYYTHVYCYYTYFTIITAHPFLSGRTAPRMLGEDAEYDVFISYR